MKSYTDLEQSKKLAEFLPLETADMCWIKIDDDESFDGSWEVVPRNSSLIAIDENFDIPCWSLAALLDILPNDEVTTTTVTRGGWISEPAANYLNIWIADYENYEKHDNDFTLSADNSIDAAFEMICWLKENRIL